MRPALKIFAAVELEHKARTAEDPVVRAGLLAEARALRKSAGMPDASITKTQHYNLTKGTHT